MFVACSATQMAGDLTATDFTMYEIKKSNMFLVIADGRHPPGATDSCHRCGPLVSQRGTVKPAASQLVSETYYQTCMRACVYMRAFVHAYIRAISSDSQTSRRQLSNVRVTFHVYVIIHSTPRHYTIIN